MMSVTCLEASPCSDNNRNIPIHKTQTYRYKFSKEILDCMKPFFKKFMHMTIKLPLKRHGIFGCVNILILFNKKLHD